MRRGDSRRELDGRGLRPASRLLGRRRVRQLVGRAIAVAAAARRRACHGLARSGPSRRGREGRTLNVVRQNRRAAAAVAAEPWRRPSRRAVIAATASTRGRARRGPVTVPRRGARARHLERRRRARLWPLRRRRRPLLRGRTGLGLRAGDLGHRELRTRSWASLRTCLGPRGGSGLRTRRVPALSRGERRRTKDGEKRERDGHRQREAAERRLAGRHFARSQVRAGGWKEREGGGGGRGGICCRRPLQKWSDQRLLLFRENWPRACACVRARVERALEEREG